MSSSNNIGDNEIAASYAAFEVRADLVAAHQRIWKHLAQAGSWLTGAERVAIAAETRAAADCSLCAERKGAASPYMVDGKHDTTSELKESWCDAVHRVVTDPGRLSRRLLDELSAAGGHDALYVELLSVALSTLSIDMFHRALGAPPLALPTPLPGEPDRERPTALSDIGAWVSVVAVDSPLGRRLYPKVPRVPNVARALTLVPAAARDQHTLVETQYLPTRLIASAAEGKRAINRAQIELVASRVSTLNQCFY